MYPLDIFDLLYQYYPRLALIIIRLKWVYYLISSKRTVCNTWNANAYFSMNFIQLTVWPLLCLSSSFKNYALAIETFEPKIQV